MFIICVFSDNNHDGTIDEKEFVALPALVLGGESPQLHEGDKRWIEERRKEFRNTIDINHDGKVSRDELMVSELKAYNSPLKSNL